MTSELARAYRSQKCCLNEDHHGFLPNDKFDELVNKEMVQRELEHCEHGLSGSAESMAANIMGQSSDTLAQAQATPKVKRRIFCILALIEKVAGIELFIQCDIGDSDLPFKLVGYGQGTSGGPFIKRYNSPGADDITQVLRHWEPNELEAFERNQWYFQVPTLRPHQGERIDELYAQTVMPWTKVEEKITGSFGIVSRIEMPPCHHEGHQPSVS